METYNKKLTNKIIKLIPRGYRKMYEINSIVEIKSDFTIVANVSRKASFGPGNPDYMNFNDHIRVDENVRQIIREEKLSQLGIK